LESAYQQSSSVTRNRSIQRFLLLYLLVDTFCLFCDYQAGTKLFHLALLFRVCLFAPLVLGVVLALNSRVSVTFQSLSAITPLLFGTAFVSFLARLTQQPFTDRYLLGAAVGIMAQTLLAPIPFLFSALAVACSTLVFSALNLSPLGAGFSPPVTPDLVCFVAGVEACFLYHRYRMEKSTRRDYLLDEANRLHLEQALRLNEHLQRLSSVDSLTGVFNRRYLDGALDRLWLAAQEHERWIAVLMVDIDHFKQVNDTHGHQHGDLCLEHVAQALQQGIRAGIDTVARYGGEEFVALLPDADESLAEDIALRIRQHIRELGLSGHSGSMVTVSIGVAALQGGQAEVTLPDFIAAADAALYQAKSAGGNRIMNGSSFLIEQRPATFVGLRDMA
jgi:diguanylate cyclase (GGDEF)-like protein